MIPCATYFNNFKTFVENGIEYMLVGGRQYRVARPKEDRLWLFPMISVFDEVAKERNEFLNHKQSSDATTTNP